VLSGEGSQTETIKALRLGAGDYVRKDEVEADLLHRINTLLREMDDSAAMAVLRDAPTPIAVPFKRYHAALNPVARLRRLIELHEAILRLVAIVGLAELRHGRERRPPKAQLSMSSLLAPAMGTWNQVRTVLRKTLNEDGAFRRYADTIDPGVTDRVVKIRNDLAHSGDPSGRVARELIEELEPGTQRLLARVRRASARFVIPTALDFDGATFEVGVAILAGDSLALPTGRMTTGVPVVTHHPYVHEEGGGRWVDLYPLMAAVPGREPSVWKTLLYDGVRGGHANAKLRGTEPLRYIDLWSNERDLELDEHPAAAELRGMTCDW
jgi:hypothetical protein